MVLEPIPCFPRHQYIENDFRTLITIQFDSDSSEDDDETTDNFKNEIGLKGKKEQIENFVSWALDNHEGLMIQIANDDAVNDTELVTKKAPPTSLDMEQEADTGKGEYVTLKISSTSQRHVKGTATAMHTPSNTNNCVLERLEGKMIHEKDLSDNKISNIDLTKSNDRILLDFNKDLEQKEKTHSYYSKYISVKSPVKTDPEVWISCDVFEETLSASDLDKIMGKVQQMLDQMKNVYDLELKDCIFKIKAPSGPVVNASGTPPPAPPPPPPPPAWAVAPASNLVVPLKIKIRTHGATLTANHSNGDLSNIEIKITISNKEDMLSQYQRRLQNRQKKTNIDHEICQSEYHKSSKSNIICCSCL